MALNGSNGEQNRRNYDPTMISRMKFKERLKGVDPKDSKELCFKYWKDRLQVYIQVWGNDSKPQELASIYLSPTKARVLSNEIRSLMNEEDEFTNPISRGTMTGIGETRGLIYVMNTKESTEEHPDRVLVISSVNKDGQEEGHCEFHFASDISSLRFERNNYKDFEMNLFKDMELDIFCDLLDAFANISNGAIGFGVVDAMRFNTTSMNNKVNSIMEKLGIQRSGGNYSNSNRAGSSYFDRNGGANSPEASNRARSSASTLEEMEEMLDD